MKESHNRKRTKLRIEFGLKVRKRRYELDISQEQLAELANLHHNYVGSVERGERNIALENIVAIAKALQCSPKDLMPEITDLRDDETAIANNNLDLLVSNLKQAFR
jgi:transcriptional regulator with XRE-family HTH domain